MANNLSSYFLYFRSDTVAKTLTANRAGAHGDPVDRRNRRIRGRGVEGTAVLLRMRFGFDVLGRHRTGCVGGYRSFLGRHMDLQARRMQGLRTQLYAVSVIALVYEK